LYCKPNRLDGEKFLRKSEGSSFVATVHADLAAAHRSDKMTRQAADVACQQARLDTMWAAGRGACLTWSDDTGWHLIDAIAPAGLDLRRRKLLGLPDGRPWCWLYQAFDSRLVARWDHARLQVCPARPRGAAFTDLRRCATNYQRIGRVVLPFPSSAPVITPDPMAARLAAGSHEFVDGIKADGTFWPTANRLAATARLYRLTRAMADQTRANVDDVGYVASVTVSFVQRWDRSVMRGAIYKIS
jgi:hypothetical protein